jgi:hypothetical protein
MSRFGIFADTKGSNWLNNSLTCKPSGAESGTLKNRWRRAGGKGVTGFSSWSYTGR